MITWRLWQGLHSKAGQKSVYWHYILLNRRRRIYLQEGKPQSRWITLSGFAMIAVTFSGIWVFLVPFLPVILLTAGTVLGLNVAMQISSAITFEREHARYEVASVLPMGSTGVNWIISRIIIQQMDLLERVHSLVAGFSSIFSLGIIGFFLLNGISFGTTITSLIVLAALYADFIQSILTAALVGTGMATFSPERLSATTLSIMVFLMLQFCFYAILAVICFLLLPLVIPSTDWMIVLNLLRLACLLLGRELLLYGMWNWLAERLDTTVVELNGTVRMFS